MIPPPALANFRPIKDWKEIIVALIAFAVIALVVVLPVSALIDGPLTSRLQAIQYVAMGVLFYIFTIVAFWLAWGKSHFLWRLVVVDLAIVFACWAMNVGMRGGTDFADFALLTAIIAAGAALPRLWGVRRYSVDSQGELLPGSFMPARFSIRDLFRWTTCGAIIISTVRWGNLEHELLHSAGSHLIDVLVVGLSLAFATLVAMWLTLRRRKARAISIVIGTFAVWAICSLLNGVAQTQNRRYLGGTMVTFLLLLPTLYLARRLGVRLIQKRRLNVSEKNSALEAAWADGNPTEQNL